MFFVILVLVRNDGSTVFDEFRFRIENLKG